MSQNKIYVGNLSYNTTEDGLRDYFVKFGDMEEVKLITDRDTGRSKGFAFITFVNESSAKDSLAANGEELDGRPLRVNMANDKERSGGGGRPGGRPNGGRPGGNRFGGDRGGRSGGGNY